MCQLDCPAAATFCFGVKLGHAFRKDFLSGASVSVQSVCTCALWELGNSSACLLPCHRLFDVVTVSSPCSLLAAGVSLVTSNSFTVLISSCAKSSSAHHSAGPCASAAPKSASLHFAATRQAHHSNTGRHAPCTPSTAINAPAHGARELGRGTVQHHPCGHHITRAATSAPRPGRGWWMRRHR